MRARDLADRDVGRRPRLPFLVRWTLRLLLLFSLALVLAVVYFSLVFADISEPTPGERRPAITLLDAEGATIARFGDHYGEALRLTHALPQARLSTVELFRHVTAAGGNPFVRMQPEELSEIFLKTGSEDQLKYLNPISVFEYEKIDCSIGVWGEENTKALTNVDPKKIGVQGHSWGGYQISYLLTKTKMFAAAEAGAPVSNMTSAYGGIRWTTGKSRMFQYEKTQSRIGGTLWEAHHRYIENSPLFWAISSFPWQN